MEDLATIIFVTAEKIPRSLIDIITAEDIQRLPVELESTLLKDKPLYLKHSFIPQTQILFMVLDLEIPFRLTERFNRVFNPALIF